MTDSNTILAEIRADVGKGASRRLRHKGKIPAVLYGGRKDPVTLTLDHDVLMHAARRESFYSSILEITVGDGRRQKVIVRDVHHHPFKQQIMHFDFMRVSADDVLRISVPIHYINEDESLAGKTSGVVIQHLVTEVEITALPENLPEFLEVDLSALDVGGVVLLAGIDLPEGVEIPALAGDDQSDTMIANAIHIKESQGTGVAAAEEAAAAEAELEDTGEAEVEETDEDADAEAETAAD
ncbi:MAG: 50S ribosomal protein L25/general stress protein Ctc, partial [Gammaproteobacteria bacterium]|nr:50S ribosomal protein L25/general stress protein Ctc [Gammaproteobacteria bacterium]